MSALVLLWWATVEEPYIEPHLEKFAARTREWLYQHCKEAGFPVPTEADLIRMGENGAFPGEKRSIVNRRLHLFLRNAAISGSYAPTPLMRLRWGFDEKLGR